MNAYQTPQVPGDSWRPTAARNVQLESHLGTQRSTESPVAKDQEACLSSEARDLVRDFVMPSDSSVLDFLEDHRVIARTLAEAAPRLREYFGESTVFSLRRAFDELGGRTLYAVVLWPGKPQDVRSALRRFDDEWWFTRSRQTSGKLVFTYELV